MVINFKTNLNVPHIWKSLLALPSFDDLSPFLLPSAPAEAMVEGGLTKADWPRPIMNDWRSVTFRENGHTVRLELISGKENYFAVPSVQLPSGERYALTEVEFDIRETELIEVEGLGKFIWHQSLV